jgi:hypothetical protein
VIDKAVNYKLVAFLRRHGVDPASLDAEAARLTVEYVLDSVVAAVEYALDIAEVLHGDPGRVLKGLTAPGAVALAGTMMVGSLLPMRPAADQDAAWAAERIRRNVTLINIPTERQAAFVALRQVGGARVACLPEWMESAIGDAETWVACQHLIDRVELAVANTNPGMRWRHVPDLGYVTYKTGS